MITSHIIGLKRHPREGNIMKLSNLKTLQMANPIGIDKTPYFSWMLESDTPDTMQRSYRLSVSSADGVAYDSGTIESSQDSFVPYRGAALTSRTEYVWTVTVTDNRGNTAHASATFETALLDETDWQAAWVKSPLHRRKSKVGFGNQGPATLFRREFALGATAVRARLYATCHGIYEATINGHRVDDRLLAPEHTSYGSYLCYQTYDVTGLLSEGANALGLCVADGWYLGPQTKPNMRMRDHAHAALFQLEVELADGTRLLVSSDEQVKAAHGPVLSADLFAGELYDARKELAGWGLPGFDDSGWRPCKRARYGMSNLHAQLGEPVRIVEELPVKQVLTNAKGEQILDFGQNMAGFVRMRVDQPAGTQITLEHCEVLDREGCFFDNLLAAGGVGKGVDQKDVFISAGTPAVFEPRFTYHGFRYVRVSGIDVNPHDFVACALSTEKQCIGTFSCANDDINRLCDSILWSQRSNMLSIPTDCPQREKAGWTGDMLVYARTAMQSEDCTAFFTRWLENMAIDQDRFGIVPMVVPLDGTYPAMGKIISLTSGGGKGLATSSGWGDAAVAVPWALYQATGNTQVLRSQYACMKAWCDYVIGQAATKRPKGSKLPDEVERYLWDTGYHYGEWLIPSQNKDGLDLKNLKAIMAASSCYTAPLFGWSSVDTLARIASVLAAEEGAGSAYAQDAARYANVAAHMRDAIQRGVIGEDGSMPSDLMGAYVLPIHFGLVPEQHERTFAENLVASIERNDGCMDTGFLSTPFLLDALCTIDRQDLAFDLLFQDKAPSWLCEVRQGGTTMWENCFGYDDEGNPGNLSFNHYAFGAVADWIFRKVGGLDSAEAGYGHLVFAPLLDSRVSAATRTLETPHGLASCSWTVSKAEDSIFEIEVVVPCNARATVLMPDGTAHEVGSGTYRYACAL